MKDKVLEQKTGWEVRKVTEAISLGCNEWVAELKSTLPAIVEDLVRTCHSLGNCRNNKIILRPVAPTSSRRPSLQPARDISSTRQTGTISLVLESL